MSALTYCLGSHPHHSLTLVLAHFNTPDESILTDHFAPVFYSQHPNKCILFTHPPTPTCVFGLETHLNNSPLLTYPLKQLSSAHTSTQTTVFCLLTHPSTSLLITHTLPLLAMFLLILALKNIYLHRLVATFLVLFAGIAAFSRGLVI